MRYLPSWKIPRKSIRLCQNCPNSSDTFSEGAVSISRCKCVLVVTCVPLLAVATFGLLTIIPLQMDRLIVPRASVAA